MHLKTHLMRLDGNLEDLTLVFDSCVAIGYAGRDQENVRRHVEELARLGVPAPYQVPALYWVSPEMVGSLPQIQVVGQQTSAEVEFFMAADADGNLFFTVVSDHSDRQLESVSVSKAKQICPKVIGPHFWALEDVKEHWNELLLECHAFLPEKTLYQSGTLQSLLNWDQLLTLAQNDVPTPGPVAFCSGTLPVIGGELKYASCWEIRITDPVLKRQIEQKYTVLALDDRN